VNDKRLNYCISDAAHTRAVGRLLSQVLVYVVTLVKCGSYVRVVSFI